MLDTTKAKIFKSTAVINFMVEALLMSFNVFYPIQVVAKGMGIQHIGESLAMLQFTKVVAQYFSNRWIESH